MEPQQIDQATKLPAGSGIPVPAAQPQTTQPSSTPGIANDTDLIEDEWVSIAKRIIVENKDDPYNLSKAITLLRADYMKKRYGKEITLAE